MSHLGLQLLVRDAPVVDGRRTAKRPRRSTALIELLGGVDQLSAGVTGPIAFPPHFCANHTVLVYQYRHRVRQTTLIVNAVTVDCPTLLVGQQGKHDAALIGESFEHIH